MNYQSELEKISAAEQFPFAGCQCLLLQQLHFSEISENDAAL